MSHLKALLVQLCFGLLLHVVALPSMGLGCLRDASR